jgi:hypothetical protein
MSTMPPATAPAMPRPLASHHLLTAGKLNRAASGTSKVWDRIANAWHQCCIDNNWILRIE